MAGAEKDRPTIRVLTVEERVKFDPGGRIRMTRVGDIFFHKVEEPETSAEEDSLEEEQ